MGFLSSLFNKLTGGIPCPACGTAGAQVEGNRIRCLNPLCQHYDAARGGQAAPPNPASPATPPAGTSRRPSGVTMNVRYTNHKGENKTFAADAGSLARKHNHIIATVAPSGRRIALSRDRIQNLNEVDTYLPVRDRSGAPQPTGRERQVLGYHKKYGTTSPLYEKLKAKYPNW